MANSSIYKTSGRIVKDSGELYRPACNIPSSSSSSPAGFGQIYGRWLDEEPVATKACTSFVLSSMSSLVAQLITSGWTIHFGIFYNMQSAISSNIPFLEALMAASQLILSCAPFHLLQHSEGTVELHTLVTSADCSIAAEHVRLQSITMNLSRNH